MKLNGNSRGGHSAPKRPQSSRAAEERASAPVSGGRPPRKKGGAGRRVAAVLGAIACLLVLCVVVYAIWEKPAEHNRPGLVNPSAESAAPAGTPEPGGVDFLTLMRAVTKVCRTVNLAGCDVNELCPPCDPTGASTAAACKIIREMLIAIVNR